jgi:8-oxo-dGTP pyrophosphatase MutT (NUDIX family)
MVDIDPALIAPSSGGPLPRSRTLARVSRSVPVCPHCAAPADRPLVCDRCGWRWHANPLPAAGVLLERSSDAADGEPAILLLRRTVDPGRGSWDLPAGYLDPDESFEAAARREAAEEAGIEVRLTALSGVYHSPGANAVSVVYRASPVDPHAPVRPDAESDAHTWVRRSEVRGWLPRMAFPSMRAAVADWAAGRVGGPTPGDDGGAALHSEDR